MSFIIKHYKCPIYKTVKCKIFKTDSNNIIKLESEVFTLDSLEKHLDLYKVKNPMYTECRTSKNIESLNNPIM